MFLVSFLNTQENLSPLTCACVTGKEDVVTELIQRGALIGEQDYVSEVHVHEHINCTVHVHVYKLFTVYCIHCIVH